MRNFEKWPELPEDMKLEVMKYLTFGERCKIRQCAKMEMRLADKIPNSFDYVELKKKLEVCLQINTIPIESLTFHGTRAVHELCRIFENPSTTAKKVIIYMPETPEQVFSTLISEFETREVKIKGKEIMFRKNAENSSWAAQILALFKEGYLEKIYVDCVTGAIFEKLVELEQFKMCKYIKLEARVLSEQQLLKFDSSFKVNYDFLQHAERLELSLCDLEPEDAWEIIKNFRSRPQLPINSFFKIFVDNYVKSGKIVRLFDVQPKNEEEIAEITCFEHVQLFDMEDRNKLLVVGMWRRVLYGSICRRDCILKDFDRNR